MERRKEIIALCGPSHSGKSDFALKLRPFFRVVSSDKIRKGLTGSNCISDDESDIWERFESTKCKFLKQGYNVILDACHISRKARWHSVQNVPSGYKKICIVFDLPFSAIRKRWLKEKRIPCSEVKRLWQRFQKQKPSPDELMLLGFDEIYLMKECPVCSLRFSWRACGAGQLITGRCCHSTCRQRGCIIIVHYLRAGLPIRLEGQWYNNKGVRPWLTEFLAY